MYRALDVFVHASTRREPFGLTIAEALACGRPAIVSRASGAAEGLIDGVDALAVPPGDMDAMVAALRTLLLDGALRERYASEVLAVYRTLVPGR